MIAPGWTYNANGAVEATAGANPAVSSWSNGFGFMADGSLAIDTDTPAGDRWCGGFRLNANGAVYGTTTTTGTLFNQGVRVSDAGAIVYEVAAPQDYVCGNPVRNNGALAIA